MTNTVEIKTSELIDQALDWAVAKIEVHFGLNHYNFDGPGWPWDPDGSNADDSENGALWFKPSRVWAQGGPIIERECIEVIFDTEYGNKWCAIAHSDDFKEVRQAGDSILIAAMRCFVSAKLGETVDVPAELVPDHLKQRSDAQRG